MTIQITADRIIDLSQQELESLNIKTISCYINMGGKSYEDYIDVYPTDVFAHVKKTGELAKTAAKSIDSYKEFFEQFTSQGHSVLHFAASSGTSAICDFAMQASKMLENVYVIDTKTLSGGIALLAQKGIKLISEGKTVEETYQIILSLIDKVQSSFVIDTLEFLHKGGRCSTMQYYAASLLRLKPIITINKENGKMYVREKCRGNQKKVITSYVENTFKKNPEPLLDEIFITHSCEDTGLVDLLIENIKKYHNFEKITIGVMSCNCAVHCGPNTVGMFYFVK